MDLLIRANYYALYRGTFIISNWVAYWFMCSHKKTAFDNECLEWEYNEFVQHGTMVNRWEENNFENFEIMA